MAGDDWADISIFSFVSYFTVLDIDGEIYFNFLYICICVCGLGVYLYILMWMVCVGWVCTCNRKLKLKMRCVKDEGYKINTITIYNV